MKEDIKWFALIATLLGIAVGILQIKFLLIQLLEKL